jgi:UDP-N-acetylmuramoylalanine--D-glutamate ligase
MADFERAEVVVRNPGVRRRSPYLAAARSAGARIEMEITWFFRACAAKGGRIAGVTGTRGKSTTTLLLHHLLTAGGLAPLLGGNLGGIETLALLGEITPGRLVALELGNWMLEGLHTIRRSPQLAIFTNLLPDHMDAYDSMAEYGEAKTSIFRYQRPDDLALFNADNDSSRRYGETAPSEHVWFYSAKRGGSWPRGEPDALRPFAFGEASKLRGAHNVGNVLAATLAAELLGIAPEAIRAGVASFTGVPHRLEVVSVLDGVTYVNDSASTAPVAGVAALRSFAEPVVLIAGGNSKKLDMSEYAAEAARRAKRVILLAGNASDEFALAVRAAAREAGRSDAEELVIGPLSDLGEALRQARAAASPGEVVLLSPGFTSFRMFLNEFDRGDKFRAAVQELADE